VANKYKNAYEDKINPFVAFAEKVLFFATFNSLLKQLIINNNK